MTGMKKSITIVLAAVCASAFAPLKQEMRTFKGKLYDVNQTPLCVNVPPLDSTNGNHYSTKITSINPKNGKMAVLITLNVDAKDKQFDEWHNQTVLILNHPKWKRLTVGWRIDPDRYFDLGTLRVTNSAGEVKEMRTFDFGTPVQP